MDVMNENALSQPTLSLSSRADPDGRGAGREAAGGPDHRLRAVHRRRPRFTLSPGSPEKEFFIDNLLVRIHFINVMIRWTGLAADLALPSLRVLHLAPRGERLVY